MRSWSVKSAIPADVAAQFDALAPQKREQALALREEILATAREHPQIGELSECLKWGEPAYLPARSGIGSTIRIAPLKGSDEVALFFICTSGLMEEFRSLYPDAFNYHGDRALTLRNPIQHCRPALRHVIALALTSKLRRKSAV
ncbi:MAG: DUF1801 domain-containing protein [Ahrensia sp.]|nr:DUF1801 domain-containing protein [Ahrensia sp.]